MMATKCGTSRELCSGHAEPYPIFKCGSPGLKLKYPGNDKAQPVSTNVWRRIRRGPAMGEALQ